MSSQQLVQFTQGLQKMRPELEKALPAHVGMERFERVTRTAVQQVPSLLMCNQRSLFGSVVQCASDGLMPDGREAALVKMGQDVAYMPMVAGLLKLARQSGEVATLAAHVVHERDAFRYYVDDEGEHIRHEPEVLGDPGSVRAVYAMARTAQSETYIEVMRVDEVEKVRGASRASGSGPWTQWWEEMAKKTAIRRLFKRLPRSTDRLDQAVHRVDQLYDFQQQERPQQSSAPKAEESLAALEGEAAEEQQEADSADEKEQQNQTDVL